MISQAVIQAVCVLSGLVLLGVLIWVFVRRRPDDTSYIETIADVVQPMDLKRADPPKLEELIRESKRRFEAADKEAAERAEAERRARELSGVVPKS